MIGHYPVGLQGQHMARRETAHIGIWTPFRAHGRPGEPDGWPLGRGIARAQAMGIPVVLGQPDAAGTMRGVVLRDGGWVDVEGAAVAAVYDRFPSIGRGEEHLLGLELLHGVPSANGRDVIRTCADKWVTQQVLEGCGVAMPAVEADPMRFPERLSEWGSGFLKPRFGSFGEGVERVTSVDGRRLEPGAWVLQRALPPPSGWAGVCLRVLAQRLPGGTWVARSAVIRRSTSDPVVNAARGAEVRAADDLLQVRAGALACTVASSLAGAHEGLCVELGVDLVVDEHDQLWPIEVNGRPRGRLLALAQRWPHRYAEEHAEACAQPILTLSSMIR
jgi:hypothetical protein